MESAAVESTFLLFNNLPTMLSFRVEANNMAQVMIVPIAMSTEVDLVPVLDLEVKISPGWIFVPSKRHNSRRGRRGESDSVRREPGIGGRLRRQRQTLWILFQGEGLALGD